ncbi:MAG: SUMF1/EgtB/PvdO family nonheme iron enzyme [candidate division KSB1 bacterium]|nr:SUMF1/EgtB/PvdO family nonheme iron enzyme [candidate division KSB1 bacterium]MDZ7340579.1 SUMF1/EgtB/PvdO family nonheme iron enzyme [candidate division KSB1 bacterium]
MKFVNGKRGRWYGLGRRRLVIACFATALISFQPVAIISNGATLRAQEAFITAANQDSTKKQLEFKIPVDSSAIQPKPDYSQLELSLEINHGQKFSQSKTVTLTLTAPSAFEMRLSTLNDFSDSRWEPFRPELDWQLPPANGYYDIFFQIRYPDSSLSRVVTRSIILDTTPPKVVLEISPTEGLAQETTFMLDASASSDDFQLLFRWDWEDDGRFDTDWSSESKQPHIYPNGGGKKTVRVEVKDEAGWTVAATRELIVYSRPAAKFTYIQDFLEPLKISLDASGSSDFEDGANLQYRWNIQADSIWDSDWSSRTTYSLKSEPFTEMTITLEARDSQGLTHRITKKIMNQFADMVYVPAGSFFMGIDDHEIDERPVHEVHLDEFWIDKHPITNKRFAEFLNEYLQQNPNQIADIAYWIDLSQPDCHIHHIDGHFYADELYLMHPVVYVSWHGAKAFCDFYGKRLPTEAEWEKTARGADRRLYAWGDSLDHRRANWWDSGDPFESGTTPVGFFNGQNYKGFQTIDSPSFFGAYDMGGNVKEWVADWYLRNYYSQSQSQNPRGPLTGTRKVIRGGGYLFHARDLRTTYRYSLPPDRTSNFVGFRCVISREIHAPK